MHKRFAILATALLVSVLTLAVTGGAWARTRDQGRLPSRQIPGPTADPTVTVMGSNDSGMHCYRQ
jgi:hypothetical protein